MEQGNNGFSLFQKSVTSIIYNISNILVSSINLRVDKEGVMEDDYYAFSPVDKVPPKNKGYKTKPVSMWQWKDFYLYFSDQHTAIIGPVWESVKQMNAKKAIIEQSYEFWGKDVFKAMIDWVFDNYKDFPQWESVGISLVCGSHYWAKHIAKEAKKQIEVDKKWEK